MSRYICRQYEESSKVFEGLVEIYLIELNHNSKNQTCFRCEKEKKKYNFHYIATTVNIEKQMISENNYLEFWLCRSCNKVISTENETQLDLDAILFFDDIASELVSDIDITKTEIQITPIYPTFFQKQDILHQFDRWKTKQKLRLEDP